GCVIVDYIQLVTGHRSQIENREREVSMIASQLKKMASELRCPVIAPTQLHDDGKVRESRAIAHHSAICILIDEDRGLELSKNRHGQRGIVLPYKLDGGKQRFVRST